MCPGPCSRKHALDMLICCSVTHALCLCLPNPVLKRPFLPDQKCDSLSDPACITTCTTFNWLSLHHSGSQALFPSQPREMHGLPVIWSQKNSSRFYLSLQVKWIKVSFFNNKMLLDHQALPRRDLVLAATPLDVLVQACASTYMRIVSKTLHRKCTLPDNKRFTMQAYKPFACSLRKQLKQHKCILENVSWDLQWHGPLYAHAKDICCKPIKRPK